MGYSSSLVVQDFVHQQYHVFFFPTLHLKGQRIPPQNHPPEKRPPWTLQESFDDSGTKRHESRGFQLGGNQGFSEKSTVDGSEIRQTHQLIW